jgi:hypothetical protein
LSERLVQQGKVFLGQFTTDRMISRLEEIYEAVISYERKVKSEK